MKFRPTARVVLSHILNRSILAGFVLTCVAIPGCKSSTMPSVENLTSNTGTPDDCLTRDKCIVAYFAPWCPNCKTAIPLVQGIRQVAQSDRTVGVRVIVGADQQPKLDSMAQAIGDKIYFDESGRFLHEMGQRGVPSWWVINSNNEVLTSLSGSPMIQGDPKTFARGFMEQVLDIHVKAQ